MVDRGRYSRVSTYTYARCTHLEILDNGVFNLQRIAIARALLKNAPILILDEVSFLFFSISLNSSWLLQVVSMVHFNITS